MSFLPGDNVQNFPVLDIDQNDIVDTNGAGDAFVGGTYTSDHFTTLKDSVKLKLRYQAIKKQAKCKAL